MTYIMKQWDLDTTSMCHRLLQTAITHHSPIALWIANINIALALFENSQDSDEDAVLQISGTRQLKMEDLATAKLRKASISKILQRVLPNVSLPGFAEDSPSPL